MLNRKSYVCTNNYSTVEPRLSGPPLSGTSIIRLGIFLSDQKMGVSLKCACALQLLPWRHTCLSYAHAQTTMWHCCLSIKWVDQGVVYLFNFPAYSLIRPALEPRCPDNRGSTEITVDLFFLATFSSYFSYFPPLLQNPVWHPECNWQSCKYIQTVSAKHLFCRGGSFSPSFPPNMQSNYCK